VKIIAKLSACAGLFFLYCAHAAESPAPRFAAPDVASSLPSSSASGIGQVTFALLIVLAAVFAVALMVKRLRAVTGAGVNGIEVLAQTSLGAKERAVIVRVAGERLLLGVASGQVTLLQKLPPEAVMPSPTLDGNAMQRPTFAALLKKSLGR
jgi:flagellar biosynthetic protein FliO